MGNFIKIDRKILKWEWWSDKNTCRLFIYMLIAAYWKDGKYKGVDIPRGSFHSSLSDLSKETNLTENEVRTALKHLKNTGEITSKTHNKFTVFSITNYDLYQSDNRQNDEQFTDKITNKSQADDEQITNKSQPINKQLTGSILKEDKNDKNINNIKEGNKERTEDNNPLTPLKSGDEVDDKQKTKRFIPPTVEEVEEYCIERNNGIDPQSFVDFYISKDWMIGKNKMKDWKAAVRTWEKNRSNDNRKQQNNTRTIKDPALDYFMTIAMEGENDNYRNQ